MSLFGAATSGVDPQTGSYLSKEQRVAMFRASQGRGGAGGNTSSGNGRRATNPQTAIVVANKMTSIVQKLQVSNQETVGTVNQQVQRNKEQIKELYTFIQKDKEAEAKAEKRETRDLKIERENYLRGAREKLVEGLSSAISSAAMAGKRVVEAVAKPITSLWQKLFKALSFLGAGWIIENLEGIESAIKNFDLNLPDLQKSFTEGLSNVRGAWSLLDIGLSGIKKALRKLLNSAIDIGGWILRQVGKITRAVFRKIAKFADNILNAILRKAGQLFDSFRKPQTPSPTPRGSGGGGAGADDVAPRSPRGTNTKGPDVPDKPATPPKPRGGNPLKNFIDNLFGKNKNVKPSGQTKGSLPPSSNSTGSKGNSKVTKLFEGIFESIEKMVPGVKLPKSILKKAVGAISKIPYIGGLIDTLLNMYQGQDPAQAIVRGLASSIAGTLGGVAGAKAGAVAGQLLIPIPVVGGVIGAAIGGILGSMAAGEYGDLGGAKIYEAFSGKESARTEGIIFGDLQAPEGERGGIVEGAAKMFTGEDKSQTSARITPVPNTSTDKLMDFGSGVDLDSKIDYVEMPPTYEQLSSRKNEEELPKEPEPMVTTPSSRDPDMDIYRAMAMKQYQMLVPG